MGSACGPDDQDAPNRHSLASPAPRQWRHHPFPFPPHAPPPFYNYPEWRGRETVINGTTWYLQPPPHHHIPRYPFPPPDSRDYRHPHTARTISYYDGSPSRVASQDYSYQHYYHNQDGSYEMTYANDGAYRGYCATGSGGIHGYGGYEGGGGARGGIQQMYSYDVASGNPYNVMERGHAMNGYGRIPHAQGSELRFSSNLCYGAPLHSIPMSGRTAHHIVNWCGLTMPVTITNQASAIIEWVNRRSGDLFGFDLEWRPNRLQGEDNKAALLQICGPNDCLIVQLLYTDMIPNALVDFLLDSSKWLGGVGIKQDVSKLERDHGLACNGQIELGALASEKMRRQDLHTTGLKKLVDEVLGRTLVKKKKITLSDWEKEYLDQRQIEYACIDAWAALAIMQKLMAL